MPRRCGATTVTVTVMSSGNIAAVPSACTTRAPSNTPTEGAVAAMTQPTMNSAIEAK